MTSTLPVGAAVPHDNLTIGEARERGELLSNLAYKIWLTLDDAPDAATFESSTEATFDAAHDGVDSFINLAARSVDEVVLNGKHLGPEQHGFDGIRLRLPGLQRGANRLHVTAQCEYQHTGAGLHRLADPVDGHVYVYTHFEPFDAHKVLACFDQPDLKAHVSMSVTAPKEWRVCSNARVISTDVNHNQTTTRFNTTPPIPPYLIAVVAGPYHVIESEHRQIPLGIWCRESMLPYVEDQASDVFEITRQGLDFFERYFNLAYPFDEYNQLFVPEFMMGAMENPGCVTFNESYVFRGRASETQLARRAETILHEMAHVHGFGDVTTMRWWGDLWLNETFATYMANLAMYEATRFKNAWVDFANTVKSVAARQDQLVTTHRIADDIPDTDSVRQNFDGITYHKGAAVLRQLVAWVGDDAFRSGVQDYFRRYKWSNATLDDFLDCLRRSSGRDVSRFAQDWLQTTGMNTLRPVVAVKNDRYTSFAVEQGADPAHPTLRAHRIAVGLYDRDRQGRLTSRRRVELDIEGPLTTVHDLESERIADLVVVNDGDLTFAKVRFEERSTQTLRQDLSGVEDPLTRALCWAALWDMTRDAELAARHFVELAARHAPGETELLLVERVLNQAQAAADQFGDPANRPVARLQLHRVADAELTALQPGSDAQLAWFRCFTTTAANQEDLDHLAAMLGGNWEVAGVTVDTDVRWLVLGHLAGAARAEAPTINAEIERDPTDIGRRRAAACLAARPTPAAKEQAWTRIHRPAAPVPREWEKAAGGELSLAAQVAIMAGFQVGSSVVGGFMSRGEDPEVLRPYVNRYVDALPEVWAERGVDVAEAFTEFMYPRLFVDDAALAAIERALEDDRLPAAALRILREGRDSTLRARRAQEFDRAVEDQR